MPLVDHPCLIKPNPQSVIWRYMDKGKFESFLRRRALFFCRLDNFADQFEGSLPRIEYENRINEERRAAQVQGRIFNLEQAQDNIEGLSSLHQDLRTNTVANCWHINTSESDAMWQLYLKRNAGVAIQTTVGTLENVLNQSPLELKLSRVRYLDYDTDGWYHRKDYPITRYNMLIPFVHKRNEFLHEQELRIFHDVEGAFRKPNYWDSQEFPTGMLVEVDVQMLVQKIVLPPKIKDEEVKELKTMVDKYGYKFPFEASKLSLSPLF